MSNRERQTLNDLTHIWKREKKQNPKTYSEEKRSDLQLPGVGGGGECWGNWMKVVKKNQYPVIR